jgi:hypothetical protein
MMMIRSSMRFLMLAAILSMLALPAFAQSGGGNGGNNNGGNNNGGGRPGPVNPAPIPLAGAGLPALGLAVGAYALVRATQKRKGRE